MPRAAGRNGERRMRRRVALGMAGAAITMAALGGVAYAADSGSSPSPAPSQNSAAPSNGPHGGRGRAHGFADRALHGQFTVSRKGTPTVVDVQRGEVTKVDPTSLTVRSSDGFTATYVLNGQTKVRDAGKPA